MAAVLRHLRPPARDRLDRRAGQGTRTRAIHVLPEAGLRYPGGRGGRGTRGRRLDVSGDGDLLGKADALLRRHSTGSDTQAVPVLTDLLDAPVESGSPAAAELAQEVFTRVIAEVEGRLRADLEERLVQHLMPQV